MFVEDIKMEREVAKCKAKLVKELDSTYKQLEKDGDWEAFGKRIKGILKFKYMTQLVKI